MKKIRKFFKNISLLKDNSISRCALCGQTTVKGKELVFLSHIKRDGSGITDISKENMSHLNETDFYLKRLSITHQTYIVSEFNSYVVRLR